MIFFIDICNSIIDGVLRIPSNTTRLDDGFLAACDFLMVDNVTKVVIPPSVEVIGNCSFAGLGLRQCSGFSNSGPSKIESIEFLGGSQLTEMLVLPRCRLMRCSIVDKLNRSTNRWILPDVFLAGSSVGTGHSMAAVNLHRSLFPRRPRALDLARLLTVAGWNTSISILMPNSHQCMYML